MRPAVQRVWRSPLVVGFGWLLLAPALAAIVLLFLPPVVAATGRREE